MLQHLVLWGSIGIDRKALLAIYLNEEEKEVVIHAFPKEEADKNLQDKLFAWKNGAPFEFPESNLTWHIDANNESILPREIRVDKPEFIQRAQEDWGKLLMSGRIFKAAKEEIVLNKTLTTATKEYKQELWEKTKELWGKYSELLKNREITWEQSQLLKAEVDETFDILKAKKQQNNETEVRKQRELKKTFEKEMERLKSLLIYPKEWPAIHQGLKDIQGKIKDSELWAKYKKPLFDQGHEIYLSLKEYKKTQDVSHLKDRIEKLGAILKGLETTLDRDKKQLESQKDKLSHYIKNSNPKNSQWGGLLDIIQTRITEKEEKISGIKITISQLQKKLNKPEKLADTKTEESTSSENESSGEPEQTS